MKTFLTLVGLIALVQCRPEPPVGGYNYPIPTPFAEAGQQSLLRNQPSIEPFEIPGRSYGVPILSSSTSAEASSSASAPSRGYLSDLQPTVRQNYPSFTNAPRATSAPLVQKHVYVHVAPPFEEEERQARIQAAASRQRHYKIIFIKAPTYAAPVAPQIQLQAQNEEKTLVYVLVKKPDEAQDITLPTAAPTQPSRPEVYFIRYKAKEDRVPAQQIQQQIDDSVVVEAANKGVSGAGSSSQLPSYGTPGQSGPY